LTHIQTSLLVSGCCPLALLQQAVGVVQFSKMPGRKEQLLLVHALGSNCNSAPVVAAGPSAQLDALKQRVNEHNVLVVAKYYSRISTARLAELLDLTLDKVIAHACYLRPNSSLVLQPPYRTTICSFIVFHDGSVLRSLVLTPRCTAAYRP
jgi:hypothetical protein